MSRPTPQGRRAPSGAGGMLLVVGVLLVALNLRGPIVAPSSVIGSMQSDLGISGAVAGLLTSLPVLCFAVATPPASWLIGRVGLERAVLVALGLIAVGTLVRSTDGVAAAMGGTVLIGVGITIGNVAIPVVVGRDFPQRSSALLGAYTAALNVGSMITLSLTVPVAAATGWRWALVVWIGLVVLATAGWTLATRRATPAGAHGGDRADHADGSEPTADATDSISGADGYDDAPAGAPWWRRPVVWGLVVAFGGQSFAYYGLTAWLPEILAALRGLDAAAAGLAASTFQVAALAGAVGVPVIRARTDSLRAAFVVVALCWLALPIGLLAAPAVWPVWCALGGAAQGGGFTVLVSAVLAHARDVTDSRRISAAMQGGGYAVGAGGPTVVGAVHEATTGWTGPLALVTTALSVLAVAGMGTTRGVGRPASAAAR